MQERLINLLETIAGSSEPISTNKLVQATQLPNSTVYRMLSSLIECGFVEEVGSERRYILGLRFVKIALTGKSDSHVINAVSPILQKLVTTVDETVFLARFRGGSIDLVHIETPQDPVRSYIYPGLGRRPLHACSSAKAILAFLTPRLREEVDEPQMKRFTHSTITDRKAFENELDQVRKNGFALCDGEIDDGVSSVAVPINIDRLGSIFSVGVVGPSIRIHSALSSTIVPALTHSNIRAAAAIQHCSVVDAELTNENILTSRNDDVLKLGSYS